MGDQPMFYELEDTSEFLQRHVGPDETEQAEMLATLGLASLDELIDAVVPEAIRTRELLDLGSPTSEQWVVERFRQLAGANEPFTSLIGLGYHDTITPAVIQRNVLENPAWYTAYTPYQPEISQGRLEVLLNFQTMITELTAMEIANASLLDEATAAAEAMAMSKRINPSGGDVYVVDSDCHPQTIGVLRTRAEPIGIEVVVTDVRASLPDGVFGALVQYPGSSGELHDDEALIEELHDRGAVVSVAADILALTILRPPGEIGADIVVGSTQRFGVPMSFGGPHAAYMATRAKYQRSMPGRLVGVSVDTAGRTAYRLALQTREQHIRREKATSNICTSQVLLAVVAALYAMYHGPDGLARIATRVNRITAVLATGLRAKGIEVLTEHFFDTIRVRVPGAADEVVEQARLRHINIWRVDDDTVAISLDETTTRDTVHDLWRSFGFSALVDEFDIRTHPVIQPQLERTSPYLTHPVFTQHRSETEMLRYLRRMADRDIALDRSMIPLGSCTMKLNGTAEMVGMTMDGFTRVHPFAPARQAKGYATIIRELEAMLKSVTGYDAVSLQPNAGSQGEFAGLLAIRAYHASRGEASRDVCLIPSSAHGTNAASAAMAGMKVVVVGCDERGDVDLDDLREKVDTHAGSLAAIMVTYPSTHGVFEDGITEICDIVHAAGGQVYLDGANLNAMVGLARPGAFGADVSHLNLHKTFSIPHGGGGPGVGPVAVRGHLAQFLPGHPVVRHAGPRGGTVGPVSAAPWGSAGVLGISWAYITLMGTAGLTYATQVAILNANYVARRLAPHYPVLYSGRSGLVAHECILDLRELTHDTGVSVDDVAKRLIDYGFHAPTMSFPVAGTLMVEPTESESKAELDRFCDAMIAICAEMDRVGAGEWPADDNPLANAPHTAEDLVSTTWEHPYARELGAYPSDEPRADKYWPPVSRIDGAYGDRNVMCSCPPVSDPA